MNKRKLLTSIAFLLFIGLITDLFFVSGCQRFEPEIFLEVKTDTIESLPDQVYKLTGSIVSFGQEKIIQHGFCWSENNSPTTSGEATELGQRNKKGSFTSTLSELNSGTRYYVRAYASTENEIEYGEEKSFITPTAIPPTVTTTAISNTTQTSAQGGGNVTSDGGSVVTARGVCWSIYSNPTIANSHSTNGSGTGSFTSTLNNLSCNTTYYVRAYATNSAGTSYGDPVNFKTNQCPANLPTVSTTSISNITQTTAQGGGIVTSDGGSTVTARGVCWSTSTNPTTSNSRTTDGSGTGSYTSALTGLDCNRTYYVRAYATNSIGTSYGTQLSFPTDPCTELPTVTTNPLSVTYDYYGHIDVTTGGNVTSDGGSPVIERGFCFDYSPNPTLETGFYTYNGSGTGSYSSTVINLLAETEYYFRAYATNSAGTAYGQQESTSLPELTTKTVVSITSSGATFGGIINDDGGSSINRYGVAYGIYIKPDVGMDHINIYGASSDFDFSISGLSPNTLYYVRAFAFNDHGVGYGEQVTFTTSGSTSTVTDIDGNVYQTIQIGGQVWMAENLRTTRFSDGTSIPPVTDNAAWAALDREGMGYCWYNNSTANRDNYGALYTWAAAMRGAASSDANPSGIQGVCPAGWHLPSDEEWKEMEIYLDMSPSDADEIGYRGTDQGGELKEMGYTYWNSPNTGANNATLFSARGGGARVGATGEFMRLREYGLFWTAAEFSYNDAWSRYLRWDSEQVIRYAEDKSSGYSVRCVQD